MVRTFILDLLGVTEVCNMLLGMLCALGNIHNFGFLKSLELTNDHLEFENLEKNFDLGATICHMMQQ